MLGSKVCRGRVIGIAVGIAALVLLMAGGAGAHAPDMDMPSYDF